MSNPDMDKYNKQLKMKNFIVAGILSAIALTGILVPLFYYTGLVVPK
ncbi:MAG: hypothetical protein H8E21_02050 [Gammaproteobacteria bacterium]|nr:hypothetical protein [Gammaproteobacteria bacterium]